MAGRKCSAMKSQEDQAFKDHYRSARFHVKGRSTSSASENIRRMEVTKARSNTIGTVQEPNFNLAALNSPTPDDTNDDSRDNVGNGDEVAAGSSWKTASPANAEAGIKTVDSQTDLHTPESRGDQEPEGKGPSIGVLEANASFGSTVAQIPALLQSHPCGSVLEIGGFASLHERNGLQSRGYSFGQAGVWRQTAGEQKKQKRRSSFAVGNPLGLETILIQGGQSRQQPKFSEARGVLTTEDEALTRSRQNPGFALATSSLAAFEKLPGTAIILPNILPELVSLTKSPPGLPSLASAMDPRNFPFTEASRMTQVQCHGVIKVMNVSNIIIANTNLLMY